MPPLISQPGGEDQPPRPVEEGRVRDPGKRIQELVLFSLNVDPGGQRHDKVEGRGPSLARLPPGRPRSEGRREDLRDPPGIRKSGGQPPPGSTPSRSGPEIPESSTGEGAADGTPSPRARIPSGRRRGGPGPPPTGETSSPPPSGARAQGPRAQAPSIANRVPAMSDRTAQELSYFIDSRCDTKVPDRDQLPTGRRRRGRFPESGGEGARGAPHGGPSPVRHKGLHRRAPGHPPSVRSGHCPGRTGGPPGDRRRAFSWEKGERPPSPPPRPRS